MDFSYFETDFLCWIINYTVCVKQKKNIQAADPFILTS